MFGIDATISEAGTTARWLADKADRLREHIVKNSPSLEDEVKVEVVGQPGSSKQQLYYLALTAANSIVRRRANLITANPFTPPRFGLLQIEYDAASNWVRCTLAYRIGMSVLDAVPLAGINLKYNELAVYNGPQCEVVGAPLNFTDPVLPGIPNSSRATGLPTLPFNGRTILTNCPTVRDPQPDTTVVNPPVPSNPVTGSTTVITTPNPKPPGDNRSRGRVPVDNPGGIVTPYLPGEVQLDKCCPMNLNLVPLVMAALTDPGSFGKEMFPTPTTGPLGK